MSTNYTIIALFCTISLASHAIMGHKNPNQVAEPPPSTAAESPMLAASRGGDEAGLMQLLKASNIDANAAKTALMVAAYDGDLAIVQLLLPYQCTHVNPEHAPQPWTWWIMCAMGPFYEIYATLFRNHIVEIDDLGVTELMLAASQNHTEVLGLLLNRDTNVNAQTIGGETALDCAKDVAIKELLKKSGGKTRAELAMEKSIHLAVRFIPAFVVLSIYYGMFTRDLDHDGRALAIMARFFRDSILPIFSHPTWIDYGLAYVLGGIACATAGWLLVLPYLCLQQLSQPSLADVKEWKNYHAEYILPR